MSKDKLYSMLDNLIADEDGSSKNAEVDFHSYLQGKMQTQLGITPVDAVAPPQGQAEQKETTDDKE